MRALALALALALSGCAALLDDSDMVRLEQPAVASRCVAWLLYQDVRPLPTIDYTDEMPWRPEFGFVPGFYSDNTIVVRRRFNQFPSLAHELAHHYGATETAADSVARRGRDCVNFGRL